MTDRELLEFAAKAEGHGVEFDGLSKLTFFDSKYTGLLWNPLDNDGDALRLAVKLGIGLAYSEKYVWACRLDVCDFHEPRNGDQYAATRRAIVRAAAEIGKAL